MGAACAHGPVAGGDIVIALDAARDAMHRNSGEAELVARNGTAIIAVRQAAGEWRRHRPRPAESPFGCRHQSATTSCPLSSVPQLTGPVCRAQGWLPTD